MYGRCEPLYKRKNNCLADSSQVTLSPMTLERSSAIAL